MRMNAQSMQQCCSSDRAITKTTGVMFTCLPWTGLGSVLGVSQLLKIGLSVCDYEDTQTVITNIEGAADCGFG